MEQTCGALSRKCLVISVGVVESICSARTTLFCCVRLIQYREGVIPSLYVVEMLAHSQYESMFSSTVLVS